MAVAGEHEGAYLPIAEHGLVGDLHTVALVGTNGTIDWYCCPAFDSPSVFGSILDKDKGGFYSLRPAGDGWHSKQLYFPDTNVLITRFFTARRRRRGAGLHADRGPAGAAPPPAAAARRRRARHDGLRARDPAALRLRPRGARGRDAPARRPVPGAVADAGARGRDREVDGRRRSARSSGAGRACATRFTIEAGDSQYLRARAGAGRPHLPAVLRARDGGAFEATVAVLAQMARALPLPRPLARDGAPLRAHAEAPDLRADRRARGRADDVAARADRRRAQLGLPLHVDPRRRLLALRPAPARLHRRGGGVHELADRPHARVEDRAVGAAADHVRDRRPRRAGGVRAAALVGLPGLGARADRQRRRRAAPARHLRRADRLRLPLQQVRRADLPRDVGEPAADRRLAVRELGQRRRGHLGDPRRPEGLHLLAADELGRDRAGDPDEPGARPARATSSAGSPSATGSTTRS